jgi:protease-4
LSEFDKQHASRLIGKLHDTFIDAVKAGRGDRLKGDDTEIFSGLFWNGQEGIELGLADAIGSTSYVAREIVGVEETVDFTAKEDPFERLARRFGAAAGEAFARLSGFDGSFQLK